ncbi:MAG: hypothetical protein WHV67_10910, partial [Thermoanaerobaculia bacterium]
MSVDRNKSNNNPPLKKGDEGGFQNPSVSPFKKGDFFNENGTYGQGIRASPYDETFYQGEKAYLIGLKNNENFRTNIGFFNLKEFPIEVNLKLYNEIGEEIANQKYNIDGFSHLQINNIFLSLNIEEEYESAYSVLWTET